MRRLILVALLVIVLLALAAPQIALAGPGVIGG